MAGYLPFRRSGGALPHVRGSRDHLPAIRIAPLKARTLGKAWVDRPTPIQKMRLVCKEKHFSNVILRYARLRRREKLYALETLSLVELEPDPRRFRYFLSGCSIHDSNPHCQSLPRQRRAAAPELYASSHWGPSEIRGRAAPLRPSRPTSAAARAKPRLLFVTTAPSCREPPPCLHPRREPNTPPRASPASSGAAGARRVSAYGYKRHPGLPRRAPARSPRAAPRPPRRRTAPGASSRRN